MAFLKSFCIAISTYSKIPMPQFSWKDDDGKYAFIFFPFVGVILGALLYLCFFLCRILNFGEPVTVLLSAALMLILIGGIHVDGFMDTSDALGAYVSKEKRLEIMKDPHVGATAVISLLLYGLLFLAGMFLLLSNEMHIGLFAGRVMSFIPWAKADQNAETITRGFLPVFCLHPVFSRFLSGIAAVTFPLAKHDGMLNDLVTKQVRIRVLVILGIFGFLSSVLMILFSPVWFVGAIQTIVGGVTLLIYYIFSKKRFGGVTGDTAGWFLMITELFLLLSLSISKVVLY